MHSSTLACWVKCPLSQCPYRHCSYTNCPSCLPELILDRFFSGEKLSPYIYMEIVSKIKTVKMYILMTHIQKVWCLYLHCDIGSTVCRTQVPNTIMYMMTAEVDKPKETNPWSQTAVIMCISTHPTWYKLKGRNNKYVEVQFYFELLWRLLEALRDLLKAKSPSCTWQTTQVPEKICRSTILFWTSMKALWYKLVHQLLQSHVQTGNTHNTSNTT